MNYAEWKTKKWEIAEEILHKYGLSEYEEYEVGYEKKISRPYTKSLIIRVRYGDGYVDELMKVGWRINYKYLNDGSPSVYGDPSSGDPILGDMSTSIFGEVYEMVKLYIKVPRKFDNE